MTKFLEIGTEVELICPCSGWFQGTRLRVCGIDEEDKRITYFFEDETGRKKWVYNDAWKLVESSPSTQEFGIPCPCTKNTTIPPGKYMGLGPFFEDCRDCGGTLVLKKSGIATTFKDLKKGSVVKLTTKWDDSICMCWGMVKSVSSTGTHIQLVMGYTKSGPFPLQAFLHCDLAINNTTSIEPWDGKKPTT